MTDVRQRLAGLSPDAKRALLADLVSKKGQDSAGPLSHGQQALWFLHQLAPDSVAYNILLAWRIDPTIDQTALATALASLARRHAALRTTYKIADGAPVQIVHRDMPVTMTVVDASTFSDEALVDAAGAEARKPFDLENGPVWRAARFVRSGEHVLALTFHHIAYDDFSGQQIARELPALYAFARSDRSTPLKDPAAQFSDYVRWQRELLDGAEGERLWSYWQARLGGELPVLNLPTSRPRPPAQTFNGSAFMFVVDAAVADRLQAVARANRTTAYVVALAAFQVLLHRFSGQDDILVGTPTSGRSRPEFSDIVGYLVNPVVVRADLSGNPSFLDHVGQVQESVLGAMEHGDFPFGLLVERLQPVRDPARSPLFQVAFIWDRMHLPADVADTTGLRLKPFSAGQQGANFDLDLTVFHDGTSMFGSWKFNTDLFDESAIRRFHRAFEKLLDGATSNPRARISALPILDDVERTELLTAWNATAVPRPDATLHGLVEAQVARTPDAPAVVFGETTLSYAELNARADDLANRLAARGVGPETRVGVCLERSTELVVALLAIVKAGGAYVPIDPSYPADRRRFMLDDAQVAILLTCSRIAESAPEPERTPILLVDSLARIAATSVPQHRAKADHLAYVIFTSGSTGRPKGAMNAHRGIVNRLLWMQEAYGLGPSDRVLQKTPFSFDVSVWEFFWPLMTGATLVVAPPGAHQDPAAIATLIERYGITTIHFVPSMLQAFLDVLSPERCGTLRRVICSGEALTAAQQRAFFAVSRAELHNLYGPTEAAVDVTFWRCRDEGDRSVPIGHPVANTQTYVLDRRLEPVAIGVEGELFLGGVQVGRGYVNRPGLTADRFIPDPFGQKPGARLYRTGDRARYRDDGAIEFLGRFDDQVKIRGFRIELGEIEARLEQHPAVAHAAVVVRKSPVGDSRIAAYVVARGTPAPDTGELRRFLSDALPDYMVPSAVVVLDALPLSPNGKLDRRALPEPAADRAQQVYVAPRSSTETTLAAIWREVLGVERVGVHDSFFELGGHSLLATKALSRMRQSLGLDVPLRTFFERPTIEGIALAIVEQQAALADRDAVARLLAEIEHS